jgi:hypothetical protein
MNNAPENRLDFFEPGDLTSLVCVDAPDVQRLVVDQLGELNYKIHTGLFVEDILLKLRAHVYHVVIVSEQFNGSDLESNAVITAAVEMPLSQRRKQFVTVMGTSFQTADEMQAFQHSVDLVMNVSDAANLKPVLRRGVNRKRELYAPLDHAIAESQTR